MHKRAPRLFKIRRRAEDSGHRRATAKRFSTSLPFILRPSNRTRRYPDHVGRLILLNHHWRTSRGIALDPHIRRRGLWRTHGHPRHQQHTCGVALNVALLRLPSAPASMLTPQLRGIACIGRRGDTTALSGLRGKLIYEDWHRYTYHSTEP